MAAQHTPGPWLIFSTDDIHTIVPLMREGTIADLICNESNARLIAAAPELLAAHDPDGDPCGPDFLDWLADRLVNVYRESPNISFVLALRRKAQIARAAIAKAKGAV